MGGRRRGRGGGQAQWGEEEGEEVNEHSWGEEEGEEVNKHSGWKEEGEEVNEQHIGYEQFYSSPLKSVTLLNKYF